MSCDYYYITKVLYIYCKYDNYYTIEIYRNRRDYYYDFDIDDKDYATKVIEYKEKMLTPGIPPIVVYDNGTFKNIHYAKKYALLVTKEIAQQHKTWKDIVKIVKVEERFRLD